MITRALSAASLAAAMLLPMLPTLAQAAPNVIYITRHGEKAAADKDPDLSPQGAARARMLGALLQKTGIRHIFSSDTRRTRQTAQPLAARLNVTVEVYDAGKPAALIEKIKSLGGPTLLVGHSNTVPDLVKMLGGAPVAPIGDDEYDRLYQVSIADNGTVSTQLLTSAAVSP